MADTPETTKKPVLVQLLRLIERALMYLWVGAFMVALLLPVAPLFLWVLTGEVRYTPQLWPAFWRALGAGVALILIDATISVIADWLEARNHG